MCNVQAWVTEDRSGHTLHGCSRTSNPFAVDTVSIQSNGRIKCRPIGRIIPNVTALRGEGCWWRDVAVERWSTACFLRWKAFSSYTRDTTTTSLIDYIIDTPSRSSSSAPYWSRPPSTSALRYTAGVPHTSPVTTSRCFNTVSLELCFFLRLCACLRADCGITETRSQAVARIGDFTASQQSWRLLWYSKVGYPSDSMVSCFSYPAVCTQTVISDCC